MKTKLFLAGIVILFFATCGDKTKSPSDTPTNGEINISVDESFQQLLDTEIYTFESQYQYAKIHASYKPEAEAVKDLLNDSARIIVITRELSENEKLVFEKIKLTPRVTKIAIDAVALIINNNNPDSLLTVPQLKRIFEGKDTLWTQINAKSSLKGVHVVFDNNNSANARFISEKLIPNKAFPSYCFAVKSNLEVIDYVNTHENAIGVIGVNWISDQDDSLTMSFLKKVKVVALTMAEKPDSITSYFKPYQAYIKQGTYPFTRDVYIVSREARSGLGTGFASFVAGDKGQRIILKSGLVPAVAPIRFVEITH